MSGDLFVNDPDFLDGVFDDEEEEIGSDYHVPTELTDMPPEEPSVEAIPVDSPPSSRRGKRRAKIKPMPKRLQRHGIASMLLTKVDGSQILFVNHNAAKR